MFESYIKSFIVKLDTIGNSISELDGYPREYLQLLLNNKEYYLHIYAHVFEKALEHSALPKEEIILLDYGTGNGMLGIFAKHCGFKKVYLNDFSHDFIEAAAWFDTKLGNTIDEIIEGDWTAVETFCKNKHPPDVIIGTDVIEHIYNLDLFFAAIKRINSSIVSLFTTASVTANAIKNYKLKKLQRNDEFVASNAWHSAKENKYAGLPFLEIRKRIIHEYAPHLDEAIIYDLAVASRGLKQEDIIEACKHYLSDGFLPVTLKHPTNTCDPVTGSWTERLLSIDEYNKIYTAAGFSFKIYNGFYNSWQPSVKGKVLFAINQVIKLYGFQGIYISPFITLVGKPK